jgi:3',5'-cyclic AMP phosphodiesterase CpdA
MNTLNTDLLPPLFDQVLSHYGTATSLPYARSDIVKALENGIVNAAADSVRATRELGNEDPLEHAELRTFDRLSGDSLSRAALIEQLRRTIPLDTVILEIAVLLIEAQIDLRLKGRKSFNFSGIEFVNEVEDRHADIAAWCQSVLDSTMQGAADDTPTFWSSFRRHRPEGLRILVEGIQLSATLRDAVPYKIRVKMSLVEPLLAESRQDERIRLLHISDLHLVEDITELGRSMRRPFGAATHNFNTARHLGLAVSGLKPAFDMVLATGDLTTDGRRASFETLLHYIQGGSVTGENPMRIAAFGLNAKKSRRLLIPGNHDRYEGAAVTGQRLSVLFEEVLGTPVNYPYVVGYRPPAKEEEKDSLTLLFFVFDSSLPEGRESSDVEGWARAISRGYIGKEEVAKAFTELAKKVATQGNVLGLNREVLDLNPEHTIRIATLHHHPVVTAKADVERAHREQSLWRRFSRDPLGELRLVKKSIESSLMMMDGADEFLRGCFDAGIQLLLFGHQHLPYHRLIVPEDRRVVASPFGDANAIHAFCCPSTMEYSAPNNGFYVFDFFDKTKVSMDSFVSMRNSRGDSLPFTRDPDTSCILNLDAPSDEDFKSAYVVKR